MLSSKKKQLPAKLYVWKELRCNGKRYPKGSVLPWRDEGLHTERVLLLVKTQFLFDEPWPGHKGKPLQPLQLDVETGVELEARLEQEAEEKQARKDLLEERARELMAEGRSERDAQSQAAGELGAMSAEQLMPDHGEELERADRKRRQQADQEVLDAEEAQREADKREALAAEAKAKAELEAEARAEVQAKLDMEARAKAEAEVKEQEDEATLQAELVNQAQAEADAAEAAAEADADPTESASSDAKPGDDANASDDGEEK